MRDPMDTPIEPVSPRPNSSPDQGPSRADGDWRRTGRSLTRWRRRRIKNMDLASGTFPAARVLQDLDAVAGDADAASVILARFATLQVVIQATRGVIVGASLADTRRLAEIYLAPSPAFRPGEREALDTILTLLADGPNPALVNALLSAGAAAEAWGHRAGGCAYYQVAYDLAAPQGLTESCKAAIKGIVSCDGDLELD